MSIPEHRSDIVADMMSRTGIDAPMIERLVHAFYTKVRRDDLLGPIFAARIQDWDKHLERMCLFWSSVALGAGAYHGSPMQLHAPLPIDARTPLSGTSACRNLRSWATGWVRRREATTSLDVTLIPFASDRAASTPAGAAHIPRNFG